MQEAPCVGGGDGTVTAEEVHDEVWHDVRCDRNINYLSGVCSA